MKCTSVKHSLSRIRRLRSQTEIVRGRPAPGIRECFTDVPNYQPYTALPNNIPLDEMNPISASLLAKSVIGSNKV
jgi:hypothetical protein